MKRGPTPYAALLLAASLGGCASIFPKAASKSYYDLKYAPEGVRCAESYPSPVEVWSFGAAAPYDRTDMVVVDGRQVSFSNDHQWVDRPGALVADALMRDLGGGDLFPLVVSPRDPAGAPLQLTGTLYRFAWDKEGGSARARLEADVVLRSTGDGARILLHRRYDVDSPPQASTDDASAFARAMSGAVARLSDLVRRDLCAATAEVDRGAGGESLRPRSGTAPRAGRVGSGPPAPAGSEGSGRQTSRDRSPSGAP